MRYFFSFILLGVAPVIAFGATIEGDIDQKFGGGSGESASYQLDSTLLLFPASASSTSYVLQDGGLAAGSSETPVMDPVDPVVPPTPPAPPPSSGGPGGSGGQPFPVNPQHPLDPDHEPGTPPFDGEPPRKPVDPVYPLEPREEEPLEELPISEEDLGSTEEGEPSVEQVIEILRPVAPSDLPEVIGPGILDRTPILQGFVTGECVFEVRDITDFRRSSCPVDLRGVAFVQPVEEFEDLTRRVEELFLLLFVVWLLALLLSSTSLMYMVYLFFKNGINIHE